MEPSEHALDSEATEAAQPRHHRPIAPFLDPDVGPLGRSRIPAGRVGYSLTSDASLRRQRNDRDCGMSGWRCD